MGEIILFPTHKDYCGKCECMGMMGECTNEKYIQNPYKVCCVWRRCPYRKERKHEQTTRSGENYDIL